VYELQGFFDDARQDFERAAEAARAAHDQTAEWQALLSLGLLWAGRDYERCGEYCRLAFELAQQTGQSRLVAHSYNRLGNWHLNVERPREAADCHDQALSIFEGLHDEAGVAETLDLLGMSSMIGGDLARAVHYYQQAIELNGRLGNQLALANCLGSQVLAAGGAYQTMTLPPGPLAADDLSAQGEQAIGMTHAIGWRDGESFVDMTLGTHSLHHGHHARALRASQDGLTIATEIGHQQWQAANHYVLGLVYYDILATARAIEEIEAGLALSRAIRSQHWVRCHVGMLTVLYVDAQRLAQAEAVQAIVSEVRQSPESIGERLVNFGRAYLARARGDWPRALEYIESVIAAGRAVQPKGPPNPVPLLLWLRGQVLGDAGQWEAAEVDLRTGLASALAHQEQPLVWRLRQALAGVLALAGREAEAANERELARALVAELAAGLPDAELQENFRHQSGLF
jgi:tetratricopeptide (TPR) repeat protein